MSFKYNFSANTGYLWKELPFLERLAMAKKYDFETVEFHDEPYKENIKKLQLVLSELDLKVNGINIRMGEKRNVKDLSKITLRIGVKTCGVHFIILGGILSGDGSLVSNPMPCPYNRGLNH